MTVQDTPAAGFSARQPALERPRSAVRRSTWFVPLLLPAVVLIGYEAAFRLGIVEARLLPPPSRVLAELWSLWGSDDLRHHIAATLWRVGLGFVIGSGAGLLLGTPLGWSTPARRLIDPTIQALRAIPSLAWVPLFILWLGIFEPSKVALIAVGVFFPVYLGTLSAVMRVDRKTVEVGRLFRLTPVALARRILLPAIFPEVVTALRSGLGLGFMFVVAAELMGASEGLGYLLLDGQQLGKPDQILAAIAVFAVLGKACDGFLVAATAPLLRWQDRAVPERG